MNDLLNKLDLRGIKNGIDFLSGCAFFAASLWNWDFIYLDIGKSRIKDAVQNYKNYRKEPKKF
jgi:hypothetical protein